MKIALVLLGFCALYLVQATGEQETELEASELQELEDALDLIDETSFESLEEQLEIARKKSSRKAKKSKSSKSGKSGKSGKDKSFTDKAISVFNTGKKIAQNKDVQNAAKFGMGLIKDVFGGSNPPGTPVGNNKCWAIGTKCTEDCDCCPEHHCHCKARSIFGTRFCSCQVTESDKVNKCPPVEEPAAE